MTHSRKIAVIGSGYVGLPVAAAFARADGTVIGFDIDRRRVDEFVSGHDCTREVDGANRPDLGAMRPPCRDKGVVLDVKSRLDRASKPESIDLWRL